MPWPGNVWETVEIPASAERLGDEFLKQFTQRTIAGVYCPKMDVQIYSPDDALLVFDDGSQATCITVLPQGLGMTGLHYRTHRSQLMKLANLVDLFTVPFGPGFGPSPPK